MLLPPPRPMGVVPSLFRHATPAFIDGSGSPPVNAETLMHFGERLARAVAGRPSRMG